MVQFENAVERYGKIILNELNAAGVTCWIAGGAIRDYFMGVKITTDYDLFFPTEKDYKLCAEYLKAQDCVVKWESEKGMKVVYNKRTFDLVKMLFPSPQETIHAFDFTVSMFAVDLKQVYYGESSFIDLAKRQLMFNKITFPASTLSRSFRYYKKGFTMCKGEMKKLFEAIQKEPIIVEDATDEQAEITSGEAAAFWTGID